MRATFGHSLAILLSAVALLGGLSGVIQRGTWRRLLDRQTGLAWIHAETWRDFEP